MKKRRSIVTLIIVLAILFTQAFTICAMADETAVTTEKVTKVKIDVANDDGKVRLSSSEENKYTVTSPTEELSYYVGETEVEIKDIVIQTNEGYHFEGISRSDVNFYNDKTGVKCTYVSESEHELRIDIEIKTIRGKLEEPNSAWWEEDGRACWDEVIGATGYLIRINNKEVRVGDTTSKDLRDWLNWGKCYTFKVKAISSRTGVKDSNYVESDELDLTEDGDYWDYHDDYYDDYDGCGPNGNYYGNRGWIQYNTKWYYIDENYQIKKGWLDWRDKTYYLSDEDGAMVTGWKKIWNTWHFFASDGHMLRNTTLKSANGQFDYRINEEGCMQNYCWQRNNIGWYYIGEDEPVKNCEREIDGKIYRFNSGGYMITGWWYDGNGGYYYYYPNGAKAINTYVNTDGRVWHLDYDGRWDGK